MHYRILTSIVEELASLLTGARVDRIIQEGARGVYLFLRNERKNFVLLLSPQRTLPRLHLVSSKPRSSGEPHPFLLQLRSRLVGSRIERIAVVNDDRVVELGFTKQALSYRLYFELTGSSANLFFVDSGSRILAGYHPVSLTGNAVRTLVSGARYVPPPSRPGRMQKAPGLPEEFDFLSPNQSAEAYYERLESEQRTKTLRSKLGARTRSALAKTERRRDALHADLKTAEQADLFRQTGDLILANLKDLRTGIDRAELVKYDGSRLVVSLDPSLSPTRNAGRYFKKYKKARAGMPIMTDRLRQTEDEVLRLRSLLEAIGSAADREGLSRLQSDVPGARRKDRDARASKDGAKKESPGIRTILFQGWEILVGKSAAGNDRLTSRIARPDDLWLHAEGLPGSHVLVKNPAKTDIPPEVLIKAAALAALHSRGRAADKVPVAYTPARCVKKPKGAKAGLVTLSQRKTLLVKPEG